MKEFIAFILPPATALAGTRISRWILGEAFTSQFLFGFRFALGLAVGMLVFTQAVLLGALAGFNAAFPLAWLALIWGGVELVLLALEFPAFAKRMAFQPGHVLLILLLPALYSWWVFGRLSTLEGTLEFDANVFWVFKSKILFLEQGRNLIHVLRDANLGYMHMDYPMLVPCLYTFGYGAVGQVDEFVNKVWPFWMMVALCAGILSFARVWKRPRLLPIAVVTFIAYLPASIHFIRNEGGTVPMAFYTSMAALLIVGAVYRENKLAPAALILTLAGCFSTKFEGVLFAAFCSIALLPFCLRRGWLKNKALWQSAIAAAVCVVPYAVYRLLKPVPDYESNWLSDGLAAPYAAAHCFPRIWFLDIFARFFDSGFFQWQADAGHLQWVGHWEGWSSFANDDLSILPWLLVALLIISAVFKPRSRATVGVLSGVVLVMFTFLSLVLSCLHPNDLPWGVDAALNVEGRLNYPFFTAWFLGIVAIWFADEMPRLPHSKKVGG